MRRKIAFLREKLRQFREYLFKKRVLFRYSLESKGWQQAEIQIRMTCRNRLLLSHYLLYLAQLIQYTYPKEALRLGHEAIALFSTPFRKKWLALVLFNTGNISDAYALSHKLPFYTRINLYPHNKFKMIEGCFRLLKNGVRLPEPLATPSYDPIPKRIVYVAASALPFHTTGYTLRTQELLKHLTAQGWEVICLIRPGYPGDRFDTSTIKQTSHYTIDGVHYETLDGPQRRKTAPDEYLYTVATILEDRIRQLRPMFIQAASNYENALPALIAARRLGIPFAYEIRGLWELTTASKIKDYEHSERFLLEQGLETDAAHGADMVFTLGKSLANEFIRRGIAADKIKLVPNAVDPAKFQALIKDDILATRLKLEKDAFVIGYAGSILAYEGLDILIDAFQKVRCNVPHARVLIIGDGDTLPALRKLVQELNLEAYVYFIGKVPHTEIRNYYSLFDVMALPRKSFLVCQLVTPLKPLEAMAMGVALIVSDVDALKEVVQANVTALVHRADDSESLANAIITLAQDKNLRLKLAATAQKETLNHRTWEIVTQNMVQHYINLLKINNASSSAPGKPMLKYEVLMNRYATVAAADKMIDEGWTLGNYPNIKLDKIPWDLKNQKQRSWNFHIHSWDMLDYLLQAYTQSFDDRYLNISRDIALEWISKQGNANASGISPFAWYDMAVGFRSYRLAYIIDASMHAAILTPKEKTLLWEALEKHHEYLAIDKHIAFHSNHGFYQIAGQLAMGRRFSALSTKMTAAYQQAQKRLNKILHLQFSSEGVHLEHSPAYHLTLCTTLKGMMHAELITETETINFIERIEESFSWFILPNQHICNFGDSDYKILKQTPSNEVNVWKTPAMQYITSQGTIGALSTDHYMTFPKSGYYIVRKPSSDNPNEFSQSSYLAQTAAFHSRTHKHADDLSFIWSDKGSDILVDAGYYGYIGKTAPGSRLRRDGHWYSDPNRIYCESTRAHNTLEFNNHINPRVGVKPYGSAIKRWTQTKNDVFAIESEVKQFQNIEHARVLVFNPAKWLLVLDWFSDLTERNHTVKQWFHVAHTLKTEQDNSGYIISMPTSKEPLRVTSLIKQTIPSKIILGNKKSPMQGWWSGEHLKIIPAPTFCYEHIEQYQGAFITLFCFSKAPLTHTASEVNSNGKEVHASWIDSNGKHKLKIYRQTSGPLGVDYEHSV